MKNISKQKNLIPRRISLAFNMLEENFLKLKYSEDLAKLHTLQFDFTKDIKRVIH